MSTYTDASLIVTPNAKKAGKLYALKGADLDVVRATTATYVGSDGLIKTALANEVRFDYTNGSCPSILVEPQRTNLVLRSKEFDNAIWTKTAGVVVTSNSETSPDGTLTADTINFGASNRFVSQPTTLATGVVATGSIYVKGISGQTIQLAVGGVDVLFTLNGNWQKLESTKTSLNNVFNLNTFGGATARIISVWGAQLEAGEKATSYIPTVESTVTRNADVISKSGISSLIGQTEGTIFVDFNKTKNNLSILSIDNGTADNRIFLEGTGTSTGLRVRITNSGTTTVDNTSNVLQNGINKIALIYANNNVSLYRNGVLIFNDNSATIPNTSILRIGSNVNNLFQLDDSINSAIIWKTALTDQQCISMTQL